MAKNIAAELVPPERRPTLIAGALGLVAWGLLLNWWTSPQERASLLKSGPESKTSG